MLLPMQLPMPVPMLLPMPLPMVLRAAIENVAESATYAGRFVDQRTNVVRFGKAADASSRLDASCSRPA